MIHQSFYQISQHIEAECIINIELEVPHIFREKIQHAHKENSPTPVTQVSKPYRECFCGLTADDQVRKP